MKQTEMASGILLIDLPRLTSAWDRPMLPAGWRPNHTLATSKTPTNPAQAAASAALAATAIQRQTIGFARYLR